MQRLAIILTVLLFGVAIAVTSGRTDHFPIRTDPAAPHTSNNAAPMQYIDRILRPCGSGATPFVSAIAASDGDLDLTTCVGRSVTVNGSTIVTNGLNDPGSNGFVVRTAANTTVARTLVAGSNITISNADGTGGNPTISASGGGGGGTATYWIIPQLTQPGGTANVANTANQVRAFRFVLPVTITVNRIVFRSVAAVGANNVSVAILTTQAQHD